MGNLKEESITLYQPYRITNFKRHPICTMAYDTYEEAMQYGRSRGLEDNEIYVEISQVTERFVREF